MGNNKYKYYVITNGKIVSNGFDEFIKTVPAFFQRLEKGFNNYVAIIKTDDLSKVQKIKISNNKNSNYNILIKFDFKKKGMLDISINKDQLSKKVEKYLNGYGANHCHFFGVVKCDKEEAIKIYDNI